MYFGENSIFNGNNNYFIKLQIYILIRKIIVYLGELIDQKAIHNFDNYMNLIVNRIFIAI